MPLTWTPVTWTATYWVAIAALTAYAFFKQRLELGCEGSSLFSLHKQCIEENSVFLVGTQPERGDTLDDEIRKLRHLVSYHEKSGVWRVCLLLSLVLTWLVVLLAPGTPPTALVSLHLAFTAIHYFYMNYINYHHFRRIRDTGVALLASVRRRCRGSSR